MLFKIPVLDGSTQEKIWQIQIHELHAGSLHYLNGTAKKST